MVVVAAAVAWYFTRTGPETAPTNAAPPPRATPAPSPSRPPSGRGTVEITTPTEGAAVFVDGRRLGVAPQSAELLAGPHVVRVQRKGYELYEREVHVVPGRILELEARLEVVAPRLRVEADVEGAQVFLDRAFVGEAPVVVRDVALGEHRLNVSAEGYEMHAEVVEVVPGENDVVIRFKEVRLDESLAVKHKHGIGSCRGRLVATPEGLRYETPDEKHGFSLPFSSLEPLKVDYLKKNLRVKVKDGRTYNFTADSADDLLVFQKAVEAARARLR